MMSMCGCTIPTTRELSSSSHWSLRSEGCRLRGIMDMIAWQSQSTLHSLVQLKTRIAGCTPGSWFCSEWKYLWKLLLKAAHLRKVFLAPPTRSVRPRAARLLKPYTGPHSNSNMPCPTEYLPLPAPLKKVFGIISVPEFFQASKKKQELNSKN